MTEKELKELPMNPDNFQQNTLRTECDQHKSRYRMLFPTIPLPDKLNADDDNLSNIRINHALAGMSKQIGELWRPFIRHIYYGAELDEKAILSFKEELGDLLYHAAQLCNAVGMNLSEVMAANERKLKCRYPERFTEKDALERDMDKEMAAVQERTEQLLGEPFEPLSESIDRCTVPPTDLHAWFPFTAPGEPTVHGRRCRKCGKTEIK